MKYIESINYISSFRFSNTRLGLSGMREVLDSMGAPDKSLKFVHVAGTNGKGSTSKMTQSILTESGYKTGLFISPYVIKYNERMQVDGDMIEDNYLAELTTLLKITLESYVLGGGNVPNEFEVTTLLAMIFFSKCGCDIVCLEVGLGGMHDPTNVIDCPLVSVICVIDIDHVSLLGDNVIDIARQKCGIIKGGITVAYPLQKDCVMEEISKACNIKCSVLVVPEIRSIEYDRTDWNCSLFKYKGVEYKKSLIGAHQVYNASTAIETVRQLIGLGYEISEENIEIGISKAVFPARQEIICNSPLIMIDGSHNAQGVSALASTLSSIQGKNVIVVIAIMSDKDAFEIVNTIKPFANSFVAVNLDNPRAIPASKITEMIEQHGNMRGEISIMSDVRNGIVELAKSLSNDDMLLVCGSLYLAADVRSELLQWFSEKKCYKHHK